MDKAEVTRVKNFIDLYYPGIREIWPYNEPWRIYHNQDHIFEMVAFIRERAAKSFLFRATTVAIFHDWVCDPKAPKGENERLSALAYEEYMANWGISAGISEAIVATALHTPSTRYLQQLDNEADLERFSAPNQPEYDEMVRAEYRHVSDAQWNAGRRAVLEHYRGICGQHRIGSDAAERAQRAIINIELALDRLG